MAFAPEAALNAFQQLQVVTDDHIGPLRQQQLHAVDLRSAGADLDVETVFLYSPVASGLIIPPCSALGRTRRSAERFSPRPERPARHRRGPSGPASVCPGKACACFHYPSPLYAGRGSERMWLSLPSRSTLNRDMVTEQCPVWITRTDRFYSHSAIQKQCQI